MDQNFLPDTVLLLLLVDADRQSEPDNAWDPGASFLAADEDRNPRQCTCTGEFDEGE